MAPNDAAYATLVMTDSYLPGAMVLGHSLRDRGAKKARLAACVLLEKLSLDTISELQTVYDDIVPVQQIVNMQPANLYLMNRPDLISTFTKIELWKQTQYKRIVYLDADMVVLRAPNELLKMDTEFAAVSDVGWPDCFNSGMMVLNPNLGDYYALQALAKRGISFDGADQGLLNMHFTEWERLSFTYNCTPNANYQYVPAYKHFQSSISAIHYIGVDKPWMQGRDYRTNSGVYSELLGRWWAVYDRHYLRPKVEGYSQFTQPQRRVHDYVKGEETRHEPVQQAQSNRRQSNTGYSIRQPQPQPPPGIHMTSQSGGSGTERPFGDRPALDERIHPQNYQSTPWEPARQPPPTDAGPEAPNFPTQQYEMSESRQLFEPPAHYPEPPKDMWYSVPDSKPQPQGSRTIFPWEENAPRATRVFPKSREPTPPPELSESAVSDELGRSPHPAQNKHRQPSLSKAIEDAFATITKPPSPSRHIFPWESRAPKATRVFPQDRAPSPPPNTRAATGNATPAAPTDVSLKSTTQQSAAGTSWDSLANQTNKWDDDPDIARFMEQFNKPRKVPIQVVHDTRTDGSGPPPAKERRTSFKLTDFPTEIERPSLPVTPAPIRRHMFWGGNEQANQGQGILPGADGVPTQDEWNPLMKLEELQKRQSLVMAGEEDLIAGTKTPPRRQMPDSGTREEAIEAAMKALALVHEKPRTPAKPILREPHFEVLTGDEDLEDESIVAHSHMKATGTKSPTRFNPIVLEGEAASERSSVINLEADLMDEVDEVSTVTHHSASTFSYSTSSLSPTLSRTSLHDPMVTAAEEEDIISPTTVS